MFAIIAMEIYYLETKSWWCKLKEGMKHLDSFSCPGKWWTQAWHVMLRCEGQKVQNLIISGLNLRSESGHSCQLCFSVPDLLNCHLELNKYSHFFFLFSSWFSNQQDISWPWVPAIHRPFSSFSWLVWWVAWQTTLVLKNSYKHQRDTLYTIWFPF